MSRRICRICLRSDLERTEEINEKLFDLYEELCDFDSILEHSALSYCVLCQHLLRKVYNFRQKCRRAHKILKTYKWQNNGFENMQGLLPASSIGFATSLQMQRVYDVRSCDADEPTVTDVKPTPLTEQPIPQINIQARTSPVVTQLDKNDNSYNQQNSEIKGLQDTNLQDNDLQDNDFQGIDLVDSDIDYDLQTSDSDDDFEVIVLNDNDLLDSDLKDSDLQESDIQSDLQINYGKGDSDFSEIELVDSDDEKQKTKLKGRRLVFKTRVGVLTLKELQRLTTTSCLVPNKSNNKTVQLKHLAAQFKQQLLRILEEDEVDLGDVSMSKETFLRMFEKCDLNRISRWRLVLRPGPRWPERLKRFFTFLRNNFNPEYERVFETQYLTTKLMKQEEFQSRKQRPQFLEAPFKCHICYEGFPWAGLLTYHQKWHDSARAHACEYCGMRFLTRKMLGTHLRTRHFSLYRCKLCPVITYTTDTMRRHFEQHSGKRYTCDICQITHKSRTAYKRHLAKHGRHPCPGCIRCFSSARGLTAHIRNKHQGSLHCGACDMRFDSSHALRRHTRLKHGAGPVNRASSQYLGQRNTTRQLFVGRKVKPPSGDKTPVTCPVCSIVVEGGKRRGLLLHHYRAHPGVPYAPRKLPVLCHLCGKTFLSESMLCEHQNTHTGARPYACDDCDKRFHTRSSLINHRKRHGPCHVCESCGKVLVSESSLYAHMRTHVRDRCYKCHICEKGFIHSAALKEHIDGVHRHIRRVKRKPAKNHQ